MREKQAEAFFCHPKIHYQPDIVYLIYHGLLWQLLKIICLPRGERRRILYKVNSVTGNIHLDETETLVHDLR